MFAGHYATALVAKQKAPRGHIAYFLVASQLPDLLWLGFDLVGLESSHPDHPMLVSLDTMQVDMTYSHDVLPMLGWIALTVLIGRAAFGAWRPGLIGGALVALHAVTDYVGGFPHYVFGPETHAVGTGLYHSSPYVAVALEAGFTAAMILWVLRTDAKRGVRRSRATYLTWAAVFGGGVAFMFSSADLTMVELTGMEPVESIAGAAGLVLGVGYLASLGALLWAEARPRDRVEAAPSSVSPSPG